ncbi:hypothetical protein PVAG01_09575 [Phlyctema vagabunda]|uniref:Myotubularin phosphatase domain-containing protein n=1 Tax=Phlyctema vagabunda TaxID=108571 RepID=A0ABR4P7R5_9HELO
MAERLRIAKVEDVEIRSGGHPSKVTLHLTAHHLILVEDVKVQQGNSDGARTGAPPRTRESWVAYPMIAFCTFRPAPPASELLSSIRLRGRDFKFIIFYFKDEKQARDVFESIKGATCKLGSIEKLYAFNYKPSPTEKSVNGWEFYDAKAEWKRQGISGSGKGVDRGWRISKINTDYSFSPTYPALLPVPTTISDNVLNYAGRYRSRVRIPVLTYLHPVNNCSVTRCAQPLPGIRGHRSIQDEKLVSACFSASAQVDDGDASAIMSKGSPTSSQGDLSLNGVENELSETERLEDEIISSSTIEVDGDKPHIYGAQQHNLIVDARPTVNALAMQAIGLGSENMDNYNFATKVYLGIDNIHVMRDSLNRVIEALKDGDLSSLPPSREALAKSGWLKHITGLLDGAALIARQVGIHHSHVLIHCSDGWDRTSQLSALSQLLLDPYYRSIDGFIVLIEKDWLAFGHMFQHRTGFLNSEKWFATQNDLLAGSAIQPGNSGDGRGDAIENALLSAKRFFNKTNQSQEAVSEADDTLSFEDLPKSKKAAKDSTAEKEATKPKETSPVFHQFLDATYQLLKQFPNRFEFNERFLRRLLYHSYSCQYGTFLYNNEKSRLDARVQERTSSVWDYFLSRRAEFTNKEYDGGMVDDHTKGKERLIFPTLDKVRWWNEVFNRTDLEMNGPINTVSERYMPAPPTSPPAAGRGSVITGVETATAAAGAGTTAQVSNGPAAGFASLREGIAGLGLGRSKGPITGTRSPANVKEEVEVEMQ